MDEDEFNEYLDNQLLDYLDELAEHHPGTSCFCNLCCNLFP